MKDTNHKELAFFGKITAGITHEMKNVLAIIKESSGLIEDLILLRPEDDFPHKDRMQSALSTIHGQIQRGIEITSRLNRFAHDPDEKVKLIDLSDMIEHIIALSQRFARLQCVVLENMSSRSEIRIESSPVQLQMALFIGIECCLGFLPSGGRIHLFPERKDQNSGIHFVCEGDDFDEHSFSNSVKEHEGWGRFLELSEALGGTVEMDEISRGFCMLLPERIP